MCFAGFVERPNRHVSEYRVLLSAPFSKNAACLNDVAVVFFNARRRCNIAVHAQNSQFRIECSSIGTSAEITFL